MKTVQSKPVAIDNNVVVKLPVKKSSVTQVLLRTVPEMLNAIFLVFLPMFIDVIFVAQLQSSSSLGAISLSNNFVHFFFKLAEGMATAGVILMGRCNGGKDYYNCGQAFFDTLIVCLLIAVTQFIIIGLSANGLFLWLGAPIKVVTKSALFLRMYSIAIGFMLVNMTILSFFRATGNVGTTFFINGLATIVFIYFDFALVLGKFGFKPIGFIGSAVSSIIRQVFAFTLGISILLVKREFSKYFCLQQITNVSFEGARKVFRLGLPVTLDKLSIVIAYIWLAKMIAPMGAKATVCLDIVKSLERLAFIPATALAQVITALVSNYIGSYDISGARRASLYTIALSIVFTTLSMGVIYVFSDYLISLFDIKNKLSADVAYILKFVYPIVAFDILQLTAAAALRGAGDVYTVLKWRLFGCLGIFIPLSFVVSLFTFQFTATKIIAIYSCFYFSTAIIGFLLIKRILGVAWLEEKIVLLPAQKTGLQAEKSLQL